MKTIIFRHGLLWAGLAAFFLSFPGTLHAAPGQDENQQLREQVETLSRRVEELEKKLAEKEVSRQGPPDRRWPADSFFGDDWDPFSQMQRMHEQMDQMFHSGSGSVSGGGDAFDDIRISENGDAYAITINMGSMNQNDVDIQVNSNSLTLSGKTSDDQDNSGPGTTMRTRSFSSFIKTIPLPADADSSTMKTEMKGGDLVITLQKKK